MVEKREGFKCALVGVCWPGEAGIGLTRSQASCVIGQGNIVGFLQLVLSWKRGQKLGKLEVIG